MTPIYRYMDRPALDAAYDPTLGVDSRAAAAERRRALSTHARGTLPARLDVPYGSTEPERLDVFLPASAASRSAPVFLFIHGGYWRALDARDSGYVAPALLAAGWCVVVVNYALAPAVTLAEIVRQCRAALAWTWHNAPGFGGDPARIHVAGNSAGGHLGAMLLAAGWQAAFGLPADVAPAGTLLSGLYDLEPVRLGAAGDGLGIADPEEARRLSPLANLPPPGCRITFSYGPGETSEFVGQTERYMAACAAVGCHVRFVPAPGTTHFDIPLAFGDPHSPLFRSVTAGSEAPAPTGGR